MDKYNEQIEKILKAADFVHAVNTAWLSGQGLFQFCTPTGDLSPDMPDCGRLGCLTMVKSGHHVACTPELTEAIRADPRLPEDSGDVTPAHLPVFAEWQRRLDLEIRGKGKGAIQ